jgi:high-affinity nickel-transport protein
MRGGAYDDDELEEQLNKRGLMNRFLGPLARRVDTPWKIYPVGFLFGLGFDTATEIGLLALAAGVATHSVPFLAIVSLPILFAAGMSLMDTLDGAFMTQAYGWAFSNPVRKVYYNITVTGLSVVVALVIGTVELMQVASTRLSLTGGVWDWLNALDFGTLGYVVAGLFVVMWAASVAIWKLRRIEERWGAVAVERTSERA